MQSSAKFTDFDQYSLGNVVKGSETMWVHLIAVYVVTAYTLWVGVGGDEGMHGMRG